MTDLSLAVITPSYRPDLELCCELNRSILEFTPPRVVHHIVVPDSDAPKFNVMAGERCRIWKYSDLLPRTVIRVPGQNIWINLRYPILPIRGWIMQQVLKLEVCTRTEATYCLIADSDAELIRNIHESDFENAESDALIYRFPEGIHEGMARHVRWIRTAEELLGLEASSLPATDYITSPIVWKRTHVESLQRHIAATMGMRWTDALLRRLDFSECLLYGNYVDRIIRSPEETRGELTHNYWPEKPLDSESAKQFALSIKPEHLSVTLSAKSETPMPVRRLTVQKCIERLEKIRTEAKEL